MNNSPTNHDALEEELEALLEHWSSLHNNRWERIPARGEWQFRLGLEHAPPYLRATGTLYGSPSQLAAVLCDPSHITDWDESCDAVEILDSWEMSDTWRLQVYRATHDLGLLTKRRESLIFNAYGPAETGGWLQVASSTTLESHPAHKRAIRTNLIWHSKHIVSFGAGLSLVDVASRQELGGWLRQNQAMRAAMQAMSVEQTYWQKLFSAPEEG